MLDDLGTTLKRIEKCITDEYTFWKEIYDGLYFDVDVKDGLNLNIVRNNILLEKIRCEETLGDELYLYPDSYFFPIPEILPEDFVVSTKKLPLPLMGIVLFASKNPPNPPYKEMMKFDWKEAFN